MEKYNKYTLIGEMFARDWYGNLGYIPLGITDVNETGLEDIKKNPAQDYISFQSIEYVCFDIFKSEVEETEDYTITKSYHYSSGTIEYGTLTKEMENLVPEIERYDFIRIKWRK